jgi:MFS family permease
MVVRTLAANRTQMTPENSSWREFLAGDNRLKVLVFASGVALTAIEVYIGSTLMPSVVAEIGGLDLFAWVTTIFIVASIAASMFAAVRPFGLGPRQNYLIAAAAFGLGSLLCGLAPNMPVLLVGRAVQGFGGGLLGALTYMMVRLVFPERLWALAIALTSSMWAISTLVGPAIGGIFAQYDAWRWAFFVLVPASALLGLGALRVVPARSCEAGMTAVPVAQIGLMIVAVLTLSLASALVANGVLAASLLVVSLLAVVAVGAIERHARQKLLPTGTFVFGTPLAALFALMVLMQMAIISDTFVPLFLQRLHGMGPLVAGYMVALLAIGWSASSMVTASWSGQRARLLIAVGPILLLLGAIGLALGVGRDNPGSELSVLIVIGVSLLTMGVGIGGAWTHLTPRTLQAAPDGEHDVTSAALSMVQLFATGVGAALAGLVVNLAGLSDTVLPVAPANWLYGLWIILPLLAAPIALAIARREARQAAPQPAE